MASIPNSSATVPTWPEKVFIQIISFFYVITPKIKDAGVAVVAAIRSIDIDLLKESLGILDEWFTWFFVSIFALKFADTGKAFFSANKSVLMAMVLIRFISFLIKLLATLFQMHTRNIALLLLMLVLESGASILAASLFSGPALWISVTLWLCIFALIGYCCYPELKEQILKSREMWFENQNQEGPSLPIARRPPLLNNQ